MKNFDGLPCERMDCKLEDRGTTTTLMAWSPLYDRNGNMINSDPNTRTTAYKCRTCGKWFEEKRQGNEVTWKVVD